MDGLTVKPWQFIPWKIISMFKFHFGFQSQSHLYDMGKLVSQNLCCFSLFTWTPILMFQTDICRPSSESKVYLLPELNPLVFFTKFYVVYCSLFQNLLQKPLKCLQARKWKVLTLEISAQGIWSDFKQLKVVHGEMIWLFVLLWKVTGSWWVEV